MLQSQDQNLQQRTQLHTIVRALTQMTRIDQILLQVFQQVPDPAHIFNQIITRKIPHHKQSQQQMIQLLASTYYKLALNEDNIYLDKITLCFEQYLKISQYIPVVVEYYQRMRRWGLKLLENQDLILAKKELNAIMIGIDHVQQFQIVKWRLNVCWLILDVVGKKVIIQRQRIVTLIKNYNKLKNNGQVCFQASARAFLLLYMLLSKQHSECSTFFRIQLNKIITRQLINSNLLKQIKQQLNIIEGQITKTAFRRTIQHVQAKSAIPTTIRTPRLSSRIQLQRPTAKKQSNDDKLFRKVDLFLSSRQSIKTRSQQSSIRSGKIIFNSPHESPVISLHETTRFGWLGQTDRQTSGFKSTHRLSASAFKSTNGFTRRKRKEVYKHIMEKDNKEKGIQNKNLKDEMYELSVMQFERCKITFEEILLGEGKNHKERDETNIKFTGASEDNQFVNLQLTFLTIFNQQMACLSLKIRKAGKQNYLISCNISSTYCPRPVPLLFATDSKTKSELSIEDLSIFVGNSIIYYQALQQKVQRRIGMLELQGMQQLFREKVQIQLSQQQLTKILRVVDLIQSQFFWYYTKSNYENGSRLQKRKDFEYDDLSAFAVSLGKFKSDYQNCLNQIMQVENMQSIDQTCKYLSQGRLIVHRQFRRVKNKLLLEVISISEEVYKSFKRQAKVSYFANTTLLRKLVYLTKDKNVKIKTRKINLHDILKARDVFIFFMKNIIQNFIETKYLHRIQKYLIKLNEQENKTFFSDKNFVPLQNYQVELQNNSEQIQQSFDFKPSLHFSIKHFRNIILKYCQIYELRPKLHIASRRKHSIKINHKMYLISETQLQNGLNIVKLFRSSTNSTYHIFLYHQKPQPISLLNTPFYKRIVLINGNELIGNLVRRQQIQLYQPSEYDVIVKLILRMKKGYYYVGVSDCQSLLSWRIDYYFPHKQMQYSTFLDQEVYLQCIGYLGSQQLWQKILKSADVDLEQRTVSILSTRKLKLFETYKRMFFDQQKLLGSMQLVWMDNKLQCLITNFSMGKLFKYEVQQTPIVSSNSIFSSLISNKFKINAYNHLIVRIYKKLLTGHLPFEPIGLDQFLV